MAPDGELLLLFFAFEANPSRLCSVPERPDLPCDLLPFPVYLAGLLMRLVPRHKLVNNAVDLDRTEPRHPLDAPASHGLPDPFSAARVPALGEDIG